MGVTRVFHNTRVTPQPRMNGCWYTDHDFLLKITFIGLKESSQQRLLCGIILSELLCRKK